MDLLKLGADLRFKQEVGCSATSSYIPLLAANVCIAQSSGRLSMAALGRNAAALRDKVSYILVALWPSAQACTACDHGDAWQVAGHRARIAADVWDAAAWQALAAEVSSALGPGRPAPELLALYRSVMEQLLAQFPTAVCLPPQSFTKHYYAQHHRQHSAAAGSGKLRQGSMRLSAGR